MGPGWAITLRLAVQAVAALMVCAVLVACQEDVSIEMTHQLRSTELERGSGTLRTRYRIRTIRAWTDWPCVAHGCGNSKELDLQGYELRWQLPEQPGESAASLRAVALAEFRPLTAADPQTNHKFGGLPTDFTPESRLGSWLVREDGGVGCRRSLPCFIPSANESHMLVVNRIHSLRNDAIVRDLSSEPGYARFIDAAIEQLSYQSVNGSLRTPISYALSNDLRYVVAYPYVNQCFSGDPQRRFNSVVVYDVDSDRFDIHLNRETADAGLQPLRYVQYVYFAGDAVHFVSQYGRWASSPAADHLGCVDEELMFDFDTSNGRSRPIDNAGFISGTQHSTDGSATLYTEFDFPGGVVQLEVFDIPRNERTSYRLALPEEILAQVSPDRVRPGIVNGEFIKRVRRRAR